MDYLYEVTSTVASIMPVTLWDIIDVIGLSVLIYKLINFMKETRAAGLFKGVIFIMVMYLLSTVLKTKVLSYLLKNAMDAGLFVIVVLFQPEIRRTLEKIGQTNVTKLSMFLSGENKNDIINRWNSAIDVICDACDDLASTATGALIVIERDTRLGEQLEGGTVINALPSKELFGTIFYVGTPLHDGAVIIRDGIAIAAACWLPKPQNESVIDKKFGSRHRAAIGMSENSDAIIIVVSEETGSISVAENGNLLRHMSRDSLKKLLREKIVERISKEENRRKTITGKKTAKNTDSAETPADSDKKE